MARGSSNLHQSIRKIGCSGARIVGGLTSSPCATRYWPYRVESIRTLEGQLSTLPKSRSVGGGQCTGLLSDRTCRVCSARSTLLVRTPTARSDSRLLYLSRHYS